MGFYTDYQIWKANKHVPDITEREHELFQQIDRTVLNPNVDNIDSMLYSLAKFHRYYFNIALMLGFGLGLVLSFTIWLINTGA